MTATSDTQRLIRELRRDGWAVQPTGSGHYKATHPSGGVVILAATPGGKKPALAGEHPRLHPAGRTGCPRVARPAVIPYHGLPITPATAAVAAVSGGHAFVSFRHPDQLALAIEVCQSLAVDNGAFSAWRAGETVDDWQPYYAWVEELRRHPAFDFAVIPDVIDGDEAANDALLAEWPWSGRDAWVGAPVWHMHESLDRLARLAEEWPRVCLGSSGAFATVGTAAWWHRMADAMAVACDAEGRPRCKFHGLRMLNPQIFARLPLASADSTNVARNVGLDNRWTGSYAPVSKDARARVMRERIEARQSAARWDPAVVSAPAAGLFPAHLLPEG